MFEYDGSFRFDIEKISGSKLRFSFVSISLILPENWTWNDNGEERCGKYKKAQPIFFKIIDHF